MDLSLLTDETMNFTFTLICEELTTSTSTSTLKVSPSSAPVLEDVTSPVTDEFTVTGENYSLEPSINAVNDKQKDSNPDWLGNINRNVINIYYTLS